MSVEDWNKLPWWEQRLLLEGLEEEELIVMTPAPPTGPVSWEEDPVGAPDDDFRSMGFTVINGG